MVLNIDFLDELPEGMKMGLNVNKNAVGGKEDVSEQQDVLREQALAGEEALTPFVERGKTALSKLEALFAGDFDVTQDPLFKAQERAARSSLARLGLTQSGTGAGSAISQLVTGATQRHISQQAPYLQTQAGQGFQAAGAIAGLRSGLGPQLVQPQQFAQSAELQNQMLQFQQSQLAQQQRKSQSGGIGSLLGGGLGFLMGGPAGAAAGSQLGGGIGQLF